jgi:MerR family transcriptional regulator, light-induced transcriptional regulator
MEPPRGLNIAALAQRTRVAPDTLRKWEQRYGVLRPKRTAGGQRRYDEADVARVEWLRDRLAEGWRIGEAAQLLGRGAAETPRTAAELRDAIFRAATESDPDAVTRLLDQAFAGSPAEEALIEVIEPLLIEVGAAWERGELTVAQEHLVSGAVRAQLDRLLADTRGAVRGTAVLACVPGERHELGLLTLSLMLRADGWQVAHLGADTPLADTFSFAERVGARAICLSVALPEHLDELARQAAQTSAPRGTTVFLGGAAASKAIAARHGWRYAGAGAPKAVPVLRKLAA